MTNYLGSLAWDKRYAKPKKLWNRSMIWDPPIGRSRPHYVPTRKFYGPTGGGSFSDEPHAVGYTMHPDGGINPMMHEKCIRENRCIWCGDKFKPGEMAKRLVPGPSEDGEILPSDFGAHFAGPAHSNCLSDLMVFCHGLPSRSEQETQPHSELFPRSSGTNIEEGPIEQLRENYSKMNAHSFHDEYLQESMKPFMEGHMGSANWNERYASENGYHYVRYDKKSKSWVIWQKGTGKILSHHTSKAKAEAAFRAMMSNKHGSVHSGMAYLNRPEASVEHDWDSEDPKGQPSHSNLSKHYNLKEKPCEGCRTYAAAHQAAVNAGLSKGSDDYSEFVKNYSPKEYSANETEDRDSKAAPKTPRRQYRKRNQTQQTEQAATPAASEKPQSVGTCLSCYNTVPLGQLLQPNMSRQPCLDCRAEERRKNVEQRQEQYQ